MKKLMGFIVGIGLSSVAFANPVYHAGDTTPSDASRPFEISVGWAHSGESVYDQVEKVFSKTDAITARAVYYPGRELGFGLEGDLSSKKDFPTDNTYRHVRYGGLVKWIFTPDTSPLVYLLFGAGTGERKLSYRGRWNHTTHTLYGSLGVGVEVPITDRVFVAAEIHEVYNRHRKIDNLLSLRRRWETNFSLRGGIRF
ncbi:MAG: outer membrane beta-barrel protein [Elusimicrobiaceae bacterium]|nr:outer membrane beta-barrel protein [Elusimicrobiaceae bacterium]